MTIQCTSGRISICSVYRDGHLLGNLKPSFLEAENRAAVERGGDLKHGVVVMQTAAYVSHSHPFLDHNYPIDQVITPQDLCGNQVAYLSE